MLRPRSEQNLPQSWIDPTSCGLSSTVPRSTASAAPSAILHTTARHAWGRPAAGILTLPFGARSSVGERSLHTREVAGSKPAAPILDPGPVSAVSESSWDHSWHGRSRAAALRGADAVA